MDLYEKILAGEEKLSLVGLGYVGMPIAVAFARKIKVIGYDLNAEKIKLYQSGIDPTNEVGDDVIRQTEVEFTADETKLREAKFHIVAVPTPVNDDHTPDLTPVEGASRILGRNDKGQRCRIRVYRISGRNRRGMRADSGKGIRTGMR